MKLKKLHIDHFRHISDVDIDFTQCDNFAVLIGNNGSGKSSIIELIAQLIIQATYKKSHNTGDFLEYEIDGKNYILDKNYKKANPKIKLPERMVAVYLLMNMVMMWQRAITMPKILTVDIMIGQRMPAVLQSVKKIATSHLQILRKILL